MTNSMIGVSVLLIVSGLTLKGLYHFLMFCLILGFGVAIIGFVMFLIRLVRK